MTNQTSHSAGGGDPKPGTDDAAGRDMRSLLSREEIEALLGGGRAADTGIGALLDAQPQPYERLPLLQPVLERLAAALPRALGAFAGVGAEVAGETPATIRLSEYLDNLPLPALMAVWRADAWGGAPGLAVIDAALTEALLDVLLGGRRFAGQKRDAARDGRRAFTPIERAVIERLAAEVLRAMSASFRPVAPAEFRLERIETDTRLAVIAPPAAATVLARFAVTVDKRAGRLDIALPYTALEPAAERLSRGHVGGGAQDRAWQAGLAGEIGAAELRVDAVLDRVSMKLRDVLDWKIGSRVKFSATPDQPVEIASGGVKLLKGKLGRAGDRLAVRVEQWMLRRHERD
jgi:flagellar motor switch protein FliM